MQLSEEQVLDLTFPMACPMACPFGGNLALGGGEEKSSLDVPSGATRTSNGASLVTGLADKDWTGILQRLQHCDELMREFSQFWGSIEVLIDVMSQKSEHVQVRPSESSRGESVLRELSCYGQ